MVAGDIIGDGIYYYIGYKGKTLLHYFKISEEKVEKAKLYFENNYKKAIAGSKIMWGIGTAGLMAAGALHVPYKRYFKTCASYSLIQSLVMILLGVFFGQSYVIIGKYMDYYTATTTTIVLAIILFVLFQNYRKKKNKNINL
jgi:membrane protein DedA with SNARE-associated domain